MSGASWARVGLVAALCSAGLASHAQVPQPASAPRAATADPSAPPATLNNTGASGGFGENLKPTKPRTSARSSAAAKPYEPIRKPEDEGQIPEIEMFVGESRVFPAPGVARIAVGNGALLTAAALDSKEVILFANAAGTSSLFIWNADGRYQRVKISIVPGDTTRAAREIAAFLSTIPKAKASVVGANIIVEGDELSDVDLSKIEDLGKRYPQIVNFTNKVGWEQMVLMDVKVVEFPISYLREIGLKWNATGGGAFGAIWSPTRVGDQGPYQINLQTGSGNPAPISGLGGGAPVIPSSLNVLSYLNLGLNAQLNLLAQDGKSTTLAEPQLSTRNGSKATFTVGGELPYAVTGQNGLTSVLFKEYGVKMEITPKVDHRGVIRATIHAEVSSIDASVTTLFGPALLTRKADTEFNVRSGETIVLAGLLQRNVDATVDKVPLLGDIPILGALFRSKRYQNKETEMVVFVTPSITSANAPGNRDRIERAQERLQERLGPSPYLSEPLQPGVRYERPNEIPPRPMTDDAGPKPAEPAPISGLPAGSTPAPIAVAVPATPVLNSSSTPATSATSATSAPVAAPPVATAAKLTRAQTERAGSALTVLADGVVLRAAPATNADVLLPLERGATVQLGTAEMKIASSMAWRNVVVGALDGWVPASVLAPLRGQSPSVAGGAMAPGKPVRPALPGQPDRPASKPLTLDGPAPDARTYKLAKSGLALRITPDVNAEVVTRPAAGDTVVALPYASRGGWTAVQLGDGDSARRGWVASQWLTPVMP